jgi:hypothetical protein
MRITSWRLILFAGIAGLFVLYLAWWGRMILNPVERSGTDFIAFYAAGRVAQTHGLTSIYDIDYQREIEQEVVGFPLAEKQVLLYNHLPYLAPLLAWIVNQDYPGSFARWVLILLLVYVLSTRYFLRSLFDDRNDLYLPLFFSALTFFPLFVSLLQGQDTAFLYAGIVLWYVGLLKKQNWVVAAGMAFITVRPHMAIALAVPLLLKQQRAWWRSLLLIAALAFISLAMLKGSGSLEFLNLLRISSQGQWFGMKPEAMLNLLGFLIRLVDLDSNTASWISWVIYLMGIATLGFLWWRSTGINDRLLGLSIWIALLTAPHLHFHDLTLLIFPLLWIVHERVVTSSEARWILLLFGVSVFLLAGIFLEFLYFIIPYLVFIWVGWLLLRDKSNASMIASEK